MEVIESYISSREQQLETEWTKQCEDLNKQKQRCQFNGDLHQINVQLDDLSRQLLAMKGQYGNSSKMAIVTSQAFFQFEKTIEVIRLFFSFFYRTPIFVACMTHNLLFSCWNFASAHLSALPTK